MAFAHVLILFELFSCLQSNFSWSILAPKNERLNRERLGNVYIDILNKNTRIH